jgi:hypothetical protein
MAQQTAVQWYEQALRKCIMGTVPCDVNQLLEEANEIFQGQIAEAYEVGRGDGASNDLSKTGNEYYREIYYYR